MQVYGLAQMRVLGLKYLRTNTHVENATVHHEHNTIVHVMSSNGQVDELKLA